MIFVQLNCHLIALACDFWHQYIKKNTNLHGIFFSGIYFVFLGDTFGGGFLGSLTRNSSQSAFKIAKVQANPVPKIQEKYHIAGPP